MSKPIFYEAPYGFGHGSLNHVTNDLYQRANRDGVPETWMSIDCKDGKVILKVEKPEDENKSRY